MAAYSTNGSVRPVAADDDDADVNGGEDGGAGGSSSVLRVISLSESLHFWELRMFCGAAPAAAVVCFYYRRTLAEEAAANLVLCYCDDGG